MTYQLTSDQSAEVVALVRQELRDMSYEIAATDNSRYRAILAERRALLMDVAERLTGPAAPQLPTGGGEAWTVQVNFTEDENRTRADAWLSARGVTWHAWGRARRNPSDPDVPAVGEELAAARALSDLSHQLVDAAAHGVEEFEGHEVHLDA
jgi:hypothetical protein